MLVGTEVELLTDTDTLPTHASQVLSTNFRSPSTSSREGSAARSGKGRSLVIYHDFQQEIRRGDSGAPRGGGRRLCAEQALQAGLRDQGRYQLRPVGSGSRQGCRGERRTVLHRYDPHRHPRHGSGQLWLGNPHGESTADVMARRVQGKQFVEPQAFGPTLLELFGKELAIALYGCDFAGDEDGEAAALEPRIAANARAVYAGKGTVYLNASKRVVPR
ncbi:hypothetical protein ACPA9J_36015 [Pseudomonas aeruginosa]